MNEGMIERLKVVREMIREERRKANNKLNDVIAGKAEEYNTEDLMRLVGTLEAAYNHCLASIAADGDIYCLIKHISYAIILEGEMDDPDVENLYAILSVISGGLIEPCASCRREETN